MVAIGVILIVVGALGILMGFNMVGDIGIACLVGAVAALVAGIGFLITSSRLKKLEYR